MNIGDHVRFLDQQGEGTIISKVGDKLIVQDSDGFDWPMLERQLVLIDQHKSDEIQLVCKTANKVKADDAKSTITKTTKTGGKGIQTKVVDLHQNALCYGTSKMSPIEIHKLQIRTISSTLNQERSHHGAQIIFVHGKGEGILRSELICLLKKNKNVSTYEDAPFQKYGYQGAIKVTIK